MTGRPGTMCALVAADRARDGGYGLLQRFARVLFASRVQAVLLVRVAHRLNHFSTALASVVKWVNQTLTGSDVAPAARIGPGLTLFHPSGVVIGPDVVVGANCTIQQSVTLGHGRGGSPTVGDNVSLGPGAVVIGGHSIGHGSQIGSNSVVTCDVPSRQIWVGVPARYLRDV